MQSLDTVLTPVPIGPGSCRFEIPSGWMQGKTVFGGLVLGGLVRAMELELGVDERRLRSLSAELVGAPVPGSATIHVRVLRSGKAVTSVCAELTQNGELLTHAVGVFGAARAFNEPRLQLNAPAMTPFTDVTRADMNVAFAPEFTKHFEYRPTLGFPFSGGRAVTSGWLKPAGPTTVRDAALVTALADAWWIAEMVAMAEPRSAATLTFGLDLHTPLSELSPEAPLFHHGDGIARTEGYASEVRTLWSEDGRLVSINRQLIAIIK